MFVGGDVHGNFKYLLTLISGYNLRDCNIVYNVCVYVVVFITSTVKLVKTQIEIQKKLFKN